MFLSRNKKNNVYPCKPQFYYIKVGFKGVNIIYRNIFVMSSVKPEHKKTIRKNSRATSSVFDLFPNRATIMEGRINNTTTRHQTGQNIVVKHPPTSCLCQGSFNYV